MNRFFPRKKKQFSLFTRIQETGTEPLSLSYFLPHHETFPPVRDEIYCQICKQTQENLSRNSFMRGWILLALCLGIFPPSQHFSRVSGTSPGPLLRPSP